MKPLATLCILLFVTLVPAAQPAPRAAFQLNAPENGATVTEPDVPFSWDYVENATTYKLTLTRADGLQSLTLTITDAECFMLLCSKTFIPADHGWVWKEGAAYQWLVKAKDAGGGSLGKSNKFTFTVDMLAPITLTFPADGETIDTETDGFYIGYRRFTWTDVGADFYRIFVYNKDGSEFGVYQVGACSSEECAVYIDFRSMSLNQIKKFKWKVTGRIDVVSGKAKSPKYDVTVRQAAATR